MDRLPHSTRPHYPHFRNALWTRPSTFPRVFSLFSSACGAPLTRFMAIRWTAPLSYADGPKVPQDDFPTMRMVGEPIRKPNIRTLLRMHKGTVLTVDLRRCGQIILSNSQRPPSSPGRYTWSGSLSSKATSLSKFKDRPCNVSEELDLQTPEANRRFACRIDWSSYH